MAEFSVLSKLNKFTVYCLIGSAGIRRYQLQRLSLSVRHDRKGVLCNVCVVNYCFVAEQSRSWGTLMTERGETDNIIRRVYASIKESIITYEYPPGERLNIEVLAESLRVSTTPVRECLNRLVAEDLIILVPRMGFFMKSLIESSFRDLYELNRVLLDWSVASIERQVEGNPDIGCREMVPLFEKLRHAAPVSHHFVVKAYSKLFAHLANQSGNGEIYLRVRNLNDRLFYIRIGECEIQSDILAVVLDLFRLYCDGHYADLRQALAIFHDVRLELLPLIIRAKRHSDRSIFDGFETDIAPSHSNRIG